MRLVRLLGFGFAFWLVAGLALSGAAPVAAQDATPAPIEVGTTESDTSEDSGATSATAVQPGEDAAAGGTSPQTLPATGVGPFTPSGTLGMAVGALVGAGVALGAALRSRYSSR